MKLNSSIYQVTDVGGVVGPNEGAQLATQVLPNGATCCHAPGVCNPCPRFALLRSDGATVQVVGYLDSRFNGGGGIDTMQVSPAGIDFDRSNGRLLMWLTDSSNENLYPNTRFVASIGGFTTTFEVLQSFTPSPALGFQVPYMPEGMAAADHFDTYWGNLTHPIDFTQAHPLQCGYPAAAPHVGDYLTVADAVPTPAPGQGVYYVTSATYQGATRYGRKTTAGHLSGRGPAVLPVCTP